MLTEMNNRPHFQIRAYDAGDFDLVTGWWLAHDGQRRPEAILPKCGVVCLMNGKPVAALFLHMDNSCGMCLAEHAVSAPGLCLRNSRAAFRHCVDVLQRIAGVHGYHTMAVFVSQGVARIMDKFGFSRGEEDLVQMFAAIEPEDTQNG
jgi:hypothetical protein